MQTEKPFWDPDVNRRAVEAILAEAREEEIERLRADNPDYSHGRIEHLKTTPVPRTGKRGPLSSLEAAIALSLSLQPGSVPRFIPPLRRVRIVKEARRLFFRRSELGRAKAPRQEEARKAAKAARKARRRTRHAR